MPSSGTFQTLSFTAADNGTAVVEATFQAQATGSDWGANAQISLRETHDAVTTVIDAVLPGNQRLPYAMRKTFPVVKGTAYVVDLFGQVSGAASVVGWNIKLLAEIVKR